MRGTTSNIYLASFLLEHPTHKVRGGNHIHNMIFGTFGC